MTDDPHSLAAPYALHALGEAEDREFERHLETCERCRRELPELREAAAALAYAPEGPAPPPQLRERILEQARSERPNALPLKPRRRLGWGIPAVAAAAACAAIGLGVWSLTLANRLDDERSARRTEAKALALLAQPGARRVDLTGADGALLVGGDRRAALVISNLARAPKGKTYEAWVIRPGDVRPAGLFRGGGRTTIVLSRRLPPGSVVGVTVERGGGARQPTGRPIFQTETSA